MARGTSIAELEAIGLHFREQVGWGNDPRPNVIFTLEHQIRKLFEGFEPIYVADDLLGENHGMTIFDPPRIVLKESVCRRALGDDCLCRKAVTHEISHLILHEGLPKYFGVSSAKKPKFMDVYEDAEWQARTLSLFILLPKTVLSQFKTPEDAAEHCAVEPQDASDRMERLGLLAKPALSAESLEILNKMKKQHGFRGNRRP